MPDQRTLVANLTPHQLTLTGGPSLTITIANIAELQVRTAQGSVTLTPHGPLPDQDELTIIPGIRTPTMRFHPYSEGAALADYAAFALTLPEVQLPIRLTDLASVLTNRTAAHFLKPAHLHSALDRDIRFQRANGRWTFSDRAHAALATHP